MLMCITHIKDDRVRDQILIWGIQHRRVGREIHEGADGVKTVCFPCGSQQGLRGFWVVWVPELMGLVDKVDVKVFYVTWYDEG